MLIADLNAHLADKTLIRSRSVDSRFGCGVILVLKDGHPALGFGSVVRGCFSLLVASDECGRAPAVVFASVDELLDETEEDGDDDYRLERLTEDDEEDRHAEQVLGHGGLGQQAGGKPRACT
jgi:hypothetical protein